VIEVRDGLPFDRGELGGGLLSGGLDDPSFLLARRVPGSGEFFHLVPVPLQDGLGHRGGTGRELTLEGFTHGLADLLQLALAHFKEGFADDGRIAALGDPWVILGEHLGHGRAAFGFSVHAVNVGAGELFEGAAVHHVCPAGLHLEVALKHAEDGLFGHAFPNSLGGHEREILLVWPCALVEWLSPCLILFAGQEVGIILEDMIGHRLAVKERFHYGGSVLGF